ncbi:MAG: acyl-CoA dehydrogenase family protein, partial [Mycobacteriales bacterium]
MALLTIPDELRALTDSLKDFIDREARPLEEPHRAEFQDTGTVVGLLELKRQLRRRSAAAGFYQLFMPEEVGGSGVGHLGLVLCYEAVAASGSFMAEN